MAGQVPIRNGKFSNTPDFNNQGVTGITGSGVFRQFTPLVYSGANLTLNSSHLWNSVITTGNIRVILNSSSPANIGAKPGDEILFLSTNGTVTFSSTVVTNEYTSRPKRPIRLVCTSASQWILTGVKASYSAATVTDCCGNTVSPFYTYEGEINDDTTAWLTNYGQNPYESSTVSLDGVVYSIHTSQALSITNGAISFADCADYLYSWSNVYTVYSNDGTSSDIYSPFISPNSSILDSTLVGTPFKTQPSVDLYLCDTSDAVAGNYYAYYDPIYGLSSPICFGDGVSFGPLGVLMSITDHCY
jgi:hypothetical protein